MSLLPQRLLKLKTYQQPTPSLLKTLVIRTMYKMMQPFLSMNTANSSALVVL